MHLTNLRRYKRFARLVICFIVACGCGLVYAQPIPNALSVTIEGVVTDSRGQPAIATVELKDSSYREVATTTSDSNGRYRFREILLTPGEYRVRARQDSGRSTPQAIQVRPGEQTFHLDLTLRREYAAKAPPPRAQAPPPAMRPPPPASTTAASSTEAIPAASQVPYKVVTVFYATDRAPTGKVAPSDFYGAKMQPDGKLSLGKCSVSIPKNHVSGRLEAPEIYRLQFSEDPNRYIVLLKVEPSASSQTFYSDLSNAVDTSENKQALVFIHGYSVTFQDAARRTAQIAYDLDFRGVPILYSWPSRGKKSQYFADEESVQWTVDHLQQFLEDVVSQTHARTIHLVAHSMGNRALTAALRNIAMQHTASLAPFKHVVLAAPDISVANFRQLAEKFRAAADTVTLYASSRDQALMVSHKFHDFARAGETVPTVCVVKGIDTIDVSRVETGLIGHFYYAENKSFLADLHYLLQEDLPPARRFHLRTVPARDGQYWAFVP